MRVCVCVCVDFRCGDKHYYQLYLLQIYHENNLIICLCSQIP